MPFPRERRSGRRLIGGFIALVALATLVGLAPSATATTTTTTTTTDDYPYRGMGKCPLVPLPPQPPGTQPGTQSSSGSQPTHGPTNGPTNGPVHNPPGGGPTKPGHNPATPPVKPPPPRVCAKHIWFVNGGYGDPWGFALRNCTSFVAWRLRATNGLSDFTKDLGGGDFGDAGNWDDNARLLGYPVDHVPAVGAVAQTDSGRIGHVAWVSAVGEGTVTVEEYNYYTPGGYDVRTVPTSDFRYLHLDDLSPAPYLGSTRASVSAVDADGGSWNARTTAAGDLVVRRPSGRAVRLGRAGTWSPGAAPSLVADLHGRVWIAAVARDGRLLTAHTTGSPARWTRLRAFRQTGWSTTSTPTLTLDGQGRLRLFSVTARGTLYARRTVGARSDHWVRPDRMGLSGSWSTHAAPAAVADPSGRLWLTAVTRGGTLQMRHTGAQGLRWTRFQPLDHRTWSVTSSPALTLAGDGRLWLAAVTARGSLLTRHTDRSARDWQRSTTVRGTWSPYSSPSMVPDTSGRLWLAATTHRGDVTVRATASGGTSWGRPVRSIRTVSRVTDSPALSTPAGAGVQLTTIGRRGRLVWVRADAHGRWAHAHQRPHLGLFTDRASLLLQP
jgi:surface antigen